MLFITKQISALVFYNLMQQRSCDYMLVFQNVFIGGSYDRSDVPNIVIVMTDGNSQNKQETFTEARNAKLSGRLNKLQQTHINHMQSMQHRHISTTCNLCNIDTYQPHAIYATWLHIYHIQSWESMHISITYKLSNLVTYQSDTIQVVYTYQSHTIEAVYTYQSSQSTLISGT